MTASNNASTLENIQSQLDNYLVKPSNHAVLLTAIWGAGKTHYLVNGYFPKMDAAYRPVLISLYGIKSIDDVKAKLLLGIYPVFNNKPLKVSGIVASAVLKSIDISTILGEGILSSMVDNVQAAGSKLKKMKMEELKLDNILICFDDLERIDPQLLTSHEILGYINALVDIGVKVMVIANEDKLNEVDHTFASIKEKTIGRTVHFVQDADKISREIIENGSHTQEFKRFLMDNRSTIFHFLSSGSEMKGRQINFRTFKTFIADFGDVFNLLRFKINIEALEDKKEKLLDYLLKFSLMVCNEYLQGKISLFEKNGLGDTHDIAMRDFYRTEIGSEKPESYSSKTLKAYQLEDGYYFYESVYDHFTGGDLINFQDLEQELRIAHNIRDLQIPEAYQVYNRLGANDYLSISDAELKTLLRKLRTFALAAEFEMKDYITVMYYLIRNGNVLKLNIHKLKKDLIRSIRRQEKNHLPNPMLRRYLTISQDNEFYDLFNELRTEILAANSRAETKLNSQKVQSIEQLMKKDWNALYDLFTKAHHPDSERPTLADTNPQVFIKVFDKATNNQKAQMNLMLRTVHHEQYGNVTPEDLSYLNNLLDLVENHISRRILKNNSGMLWNDLQAICTELSRRLAWINNVL